MLNIPLPRTVRRAKTGYTVTLNYNVSIERRQERQTMDRHNPEDRLILAIFCSKVTRGMDSLTLADTGLGVQ